MLFLSEVSQIKPEKEAQSEENVAQDHQKAVEKIFSLDLFCYSIIKLKIFIHLKFLLVFLQKNSTAQRHIPLS